MRWGYRSNLYRVTLVFFYFTFLVFLAAFGVPVWIGRRNDDDALTSFFMGLWMLCTQTSNDYDFHECTTAAFGNTVAIDAWFDAVRGCWVGGAAFYLLAVVMTLAENCCCKPDKRDNGMSAIFGLMAGLCGAAGVIVVAVKTADDDTYNTYYWGYFGACASSGLAIILSIILFITRNLNKLGEKDPRDNRTADYVFAHKSPYHHNQAFQRDDIPLSNGVSHHHTSHPYSMYRGGEHPQAPAHHGNGVHHSRGQQPQGYHPYGYDMHRPSQRHSVAESADLSNGYTSELIHAEHSLQRGMRSSDYGRHDMHMSGRY